MILVSDLRAGTTTEIQKPKRIQLRTEILNVHSLLQCSELENVKLGIERIKIYILGVL